MSVCPGKRISQDTKMLRKNISFDKPKENILYTCDKDIAVGAYYMFGFPTETVEEAMQTLQFNLDVNKVIDPSLFFCRFYPDTEMYRLAKENGYTDEMLENSILQLYKNTKLSCPNFK